MRMVKWRKRPYEDVWRCSSPTWGQIPELNFTFVLYAGVRSSFLNRNAKLEVLVKHEGERYAKHVIASQEFKSTWQAKTFLDALLITIWTMQLDPEESRQWLLETINKINKPEVPTTIYSYTYSV